MAKHDKEINDNTYIITMLLICGANPYQLDHNHLMKKTPIERAHEKGFSNFEKLVELYSPNETLKYRCIKLILLNLEAFKDKLGILPESLRSLFDFDVKKKADC